MQPDLGRELVHRIVGTAGLKRGFSCKVFLVVVANVAARHVLVLDAGDALADFFALDVLDVAQHPGVAEVFLGQIVGAERSRVIGWQRDQVVEDPGLGR